MAATWLSKDRGPFVLGSGADGSEVREEMLAAAIESSVIPLSSTPECVSTNFGRWSRDGGWETARATCCGRVSCSDRSQGTRPLA